MNIDLYLFNCYPLNPSILQTMAFVNSTCLKISRIIFCFKTISMKNEGNLFIYLKETSEEDIQNLFNLCTPCIFVYRNPQYILQEFYE